MMPDKNTPSDNAANGAVEDIQAAEQRAGTADGSEQHSFEGEAAGPKGNIFDNEPEHSEGQVEADILQFDDQGVVDESVLLTETEQLQIQIAEAQAKAAEHWDRLLRLQAEMENQRKRAQNDVAKARKFALESIVGDLLPVKDSLELGLAAAHAADADPKSIIEVVDLTVKMLSQVFEKNNILEVNPVDEKFNPEFHQAMSMQEVEGVAANTVTSVMQKGYTLNDRLVRPALVMVAK
ncbi:MAG: molecular chaperone GrpE [Flavobacteriaceae bacterium]|jgi:molecular chaperone GrpE